MDRRVVRRVPWDSLALRSRVPLAPPQRILIVTLETRQHLRGLVDLHNRSCQEYATEHGYEYRFLSSYVGAATPAMPVYWQKLQLVADVMKEPFDYVMWMDSDTLILRPEVPLEVLVAMAPAAAIYIGKDEESDSYCAGVFMLRNDAVGKEFLAACLEVYQGRPACRNNSGALALNGDWGGECYEQGIMNELLKGRYKDELHHISREFLYNGYNESYDVVIVHIFNRKQAAEEFFREYLASHIPRLPFGKSPSPPSAAVLLTMNSREATLQAYEGVAVRWLRETPFHLYAVDSAGVGLSLDHPRFQGCHVFRQAPEAGHESLLERERILRAFGCFEVEWRRYNLVFIVTGTYIAPSLAIAVQHLPSDVDLVLPFSVSTRSHDVELFGTRPSLLHIVLARVSQSTPIEAALASEARENPKQLRIIRLPALDTQS